MSEVSSFLVHSNITCMFIILVVYHEIVMLLLYIDIDEEDEHRVFDSSVCGVEKSDETDFSLRKAIKRLSRETVGSVSKAFKRRKRYGRV